MNVYTSNPTLDEKARIEKERKEEEERERTEREERQKIYASEGSRLKNESEDFKAILASRRAVWQEKAKQSTESEDVGDAVGNRRTQSIKVGKISAL